MKRTSPEAAQNRDAIAAVLAKYLPKQGLVLEIASGTGEHAVHFARQFKDLAWQPSDPDPQARASIDAWREESALSNLLPALDLDVTVAPWPIAKADAIICIDFVHAVHMQIVTALFGYGARILPSGGLFYLYAPFRIHGKYASKANEELDLTLRARDPDLGLRDIRELTAIGTRSGLGLEHLLATGVNQSLVFTRRAMLPTTGQFRL